MVGRHFVSSRGSAVIVAIILASIVIYAALVISKRTPPSPRGGAALLALLVCAGCQTTQPLTESVFPAGWERACQDGEREAVQWYTRKYGSTPANPYWELELVPDSRLPGDWAQCVSSRRIIARVACPKSNMAHENRHRLNKANNKLDNEETVR